MKAGAICCYCINRCLTREALQRHSLVLRPFPPPVFDRLQCAKTEGEGMGERVTCVTSGRREGRRCPIVVTHKLCVDQPRVYRTTELY